MSLTDSSIRNAKPGVTPKGKITERSYKLGDAGGLYLEVTPTGGKWWRLKYRFGDFDNQVFDLALDHIHDTAVARAYDRGQRLKQRVDLMTWWGDQLEKAEHGGDVVRLRTKSHLHAVPTEA